MERKFPPESFSFSQIDPSYSVPVTPVASSSAAAPGSEVASLHRKVETLSDENQILKSEVANLKKRLAVSAAAGAPPSKKARTPSQKKKLFKKWVKALMRESAKHREIFDMFKQDRYEVTVKDQGIWSPTEFHDLFDGHGEKIQPLPDFNPKAIITKLRFYPYDDVKRLFEDVGGADIPKFGYEVQLWQRKGFRGYSKYDTAGSRLRSLEIRYNKNSKALSLIFGLAYGCFYEESEDEEEEAVSSDVASEDKKSPSSVASGDKENRENSSVASELTNPSR